MPRFRLRPDGKLRLTENDVEKQCLDLLGYRGFYAIRLQSGLFIPATREVIQALKQAGVRYRVVTIGEPGIPDYVIPGKRDGFFLETKGPGGKLEPMQEQKHWELSTLRKLPTVVAYDVEDLNRWLDQNRS